MNKVMVLMTCQITFIKLHSKAKIPIRDTRASAGFDLFSVEHCVIKPGERVLVNTGLTFVMPVGTYARLASRSSYAVRGIDVGAGVVDPDYTGSVKVLLINYSNEDFIVQEGDRFAQVIFEYYHVGDMIEVFNCEPGNTLMDENAIVVYKTDPNTRLPEKYSDDSVAFDFFAEMAFLMQPKSQRIIRTGLRFKFSSKTYGFISSNLELAKQGLDCLESLIEPDDRSAKITLINKSDHPIFIEKGEKIARLVFVKNAASVSATAIHEDPVTVQSSQAQSSQAQSSQAQSSQAQSSQAQSSQAQSSQAQSSRGDSGFGSTGNR